jgi:hypothetical protein
MAWYSGRNVSQLADDTVLKDGYIHVSDVEWEGTSLLDDAVPATATFTITGTFADDLYNSTSLPNLEFKDDDGDVCSVVIDDSDGTAKTVTFDSTAALKVKDGITAANVTDATSYQIKILTPNSVADAWAAYAGQYIGDTTDKTFENQNEEARLEVGTPLFLRAKGDTKIAYVYNFTYYQVINTEMNKSGYRGVDFGENDGVAFGVNRPVAGRKRLYIIGEDTAGNVSMRVLLYGELNVTGEGGGNGEYKNYTCTFELFPDPLYPEDGNMFTIPDLVA